MALTFLDVRKGACSHVVITLAEQRAASVDSGFSCVAENGQCRVGRPACAAFDKARSLSPCGRNIDVTLTWLTWGRTTLHTA